METPAFMLKPTGTPTAEMPVLLPRSPAAPAIPVPRTRPRHPLTGRHALLVGINYAPEPTGIAPYTTGMAEHLAEHARTVTVLTGMPHYPTWRLESQYRWRLRCRQVAVQAEDDFNDVAGLTTEPGLLIRRLRHYVPARQSALTRAGYELTFMLNALATRVQHRPDVVIAVTPSLGGAVAGARLAQRYNSKLLVVVQDLMAKAASQSGISGGGRATAATGAIERYALGRADRVAVVSDAFRGQLHEYGVPDEKIRVLPNWTHIASSELDRQEARQALGWPLHPFTVVHTGNIGLKQDLGNLVETARLCRDEPDLRFVIVGEGSQRSAIETQAAGLPNLEFIDPLDGEKYPQALAAADLLVVNERPGVGDMSLPSKLTSYLTAGRAVLAAVAPDGATAQELRRTAGAASVVKPGYAPVLAEEVLRLREDPARCLQMGRLGRQYADDALGRDAAAGRLDALIEECLNQ
jgi:glycosyltransferase involved in cell wall biosynthesis